MGRNIKRANNSHTWWLEMAFAWLAVFWGTTGGAGKGPLGSALMATGLQTTWMYLMVGAGSLCIAVLLVDHYSKHLHSHRITMFCAYLRTLCQGVFLCVWGYVIKMHLTTDVLDTLVFIPKIAPVMFFFHAYPAKCNWKVALTLDEKKPTEAIQYERRAA